MLPLEFERIKKKDPTVGQHLFECCGRANDIEWKILDAYRGAVKLMTIEAMYVKKLKR